MFGGIKQAAVDAIEALTVLIERLEKVVDQLEKQAPPPTD